MADGAEQLFSKIPTLSLSKGRDPYYLENVVVLRRVIPNPKGEESAAAGAPVLERRRGDAAWNDTLRLRRLFSTNGVTWRNLSEIPNTARDPYALKSAGFAGESVSVLRGLSSDGRDPSPSASSGSGLRKHYFKSNDLKYSANCLPMSGRLSANSTLAFKNPSLSPASWRLPSKV